MESLKELYKAGPGPSSSHTLAPMRACELFKQHVSQVTHYEVELYGSLSLTGKGHYTDAIIEKTLAPIPTKVFFNTDWDYDFPSGLILKAFNQDRCELTWVVYSLGGGSIKILNSEYDFQKPVYPQTSLTEVFQFCKENKLTLPNYVYHYEPDIKPYLEEMLMVMFNSVREGLKQDGLLPGTLKLKRVAKDLYFKASHNASEDKGKRLRLMAYSYAVSEQNASNQTVVTAPTMGACGIIPSLLYYAYYDLGFEKHRLIDALAVAGIFGNLIKTNATISGAIGGCQAEVGSACSMAAAAKAFLDGHSMKVIENAAEIAMEHHLGLTCDPIAGYVMIPCIERNAAAVLRAFDAVFMSSTLSDFKDNVVGFDEVVSTMNYTGQKLVVELKETSLGGLATIVNVDKKSV